MHEIFVQSLTAAVSLTCFVPFACILFSYGSRRVRNIRKQHAYEIFNNTLLLNVKPARLSVKTYEIFFIFSTQKVTRKKHVFSKAEPLHLDSWSFLTFLHHGIEIVERHLL